MGYELAKNDRDVAWAAGLFEGEGSVDAPQAAITLSTSDKDVFDRFVAVVGPGSVWTVEPKNPKHKLLYTWKITGKKARPAIELLLPWMGKRRAVAMAAALARVAEIGPSNAEKTHCLRGHEFTEANTYRPRSGQRVCRACWTVRNRRRGLRASA